MTQVGQTISASQFNKLYPVGTTISGKEFASKYGNVPKPSQPQHQQGLLQTLGVMPKNSGDVIQKPNSIGQFLTPRASDVQTKMSQGKKVSLDERVGAGGDAAQLFGGLLGPLGFAAGSAIHGATTPKASVGNRVKNAAIEGVAGAALGKAGEVGAKILSKVPAVSKGIVKGAESVYPKLEEAAANAGRSSWSKTIKPNLNSETVNKIGTASQKTQVAQLLKKELSGLASNYGNAGADKGPLFHTLLELRSAAGKAANYANGTAPTLENQVNRAFQEAYSKMLKDGAGTADLDKLYSLLKKVDAVKGLVKKHAVGAALTGTVGAGVYKLLGR